MHEVGAVRFVISELEKTKPKKARLKLGKMKASRESFEELFKEYTKGTSLDGIKLEIEQIPVEIKCECGFSGNVDVVEHVHFVRCPKCGKIAEIIKGEELKIIL